LPAKKITWHAKEVAALLNDLKTDPHNGLTKDEVTIRFGKHGDNDSKKKNGTSPLTLFINQFKNVLIITRLTAMLLSAIIEIPGLA